MQFPNVDQLAAAIGCGRVPAERWHPLLKESCNAYDITETYRLTAYLAQLGHESASLTRMVEALSYSPERLREVCLASQEGTRWRSLLPRVGELARNAKGLAEAAYGGRMGNGPEGSGDGWNYRGRGPIQVTGKANYDGVSVLLRKKLANAPNFVADPDALSEPRWAAYSAAAIWFDRGCNDLADARDFRAITKRINGGLNGLADRQVRLAKAQKALA